MLSLPGLTRQSIWRTRWMRGSSPRMTAEKSIRCAIVIEKADGNYSAYVPDLPGCVATGATAKAVEGEICAAIRFHIDGLKEDGLPVPGPTSIADYVEAQSGLMVRSGRSARLGPWAAPSFETGASALLRMRAEEV
jgi:predicted RNase H-like HicB family nuclease